MVLRPKNSDTYEVIGNCWIYGLMDGESLLGQLPLGWSIRISDESVDDDYIYEPRYFNRETKVLSKEDPRLGLLPEDWEIIQQQRIPDDPLLFAPHRNKLTGEVINSDPRLLPEALIARGVKLRTFKLL